MTTWRIERGECIEVMRGMPDASVHAVITDPPYGMAYRSNRRVATRQFDAIEQDATFDRSFHHEWMSECHRVMVEHAHLYLFCSDHHIGAFRAIASEAGFRVKRTLVWVKDAWTSGDLDGDYGHQIGNVLHVRRVPPQHLVHPTQKPVGVIRPLIVKSTAADETVLDPFAGSGSTGIAATEEGRRFIGIETDAAYCHAANARLSQGNLFASLDDVA